MAKTKPPQASPPADRPAAEGSWIDVYALHFPSAAPTHQGPFREGLGLDGYDRKAGTEVPTHPVLKARGDTKPKADPFGAKH